METDHMKLSPIAVPAQDISQSPNKTVLIQSQTISGNARVQNGDVYIRRASLTSDRNRGDILRWLSPLCFRQTHEAIRDKAHLPDKFDTSRDEYYPGRWLLDSKIFDDWRSREIHKLWYLGMPGAGKTVLASSIIAHLLELQSTLKVDKKSQRVAYLYLSYKESPTPEQLIGCLLKQLISDDPVLPSSLTRLWGHCGQGSEPATLRDLSTLLGELAKEREIFLILDALDECSPDIRLDLMNAIQPDTKNISILITSRQLDEFDEISRNFYKETIRADLRDIDMFIDQWFIANSRLRKFSAKDPKLQDDVRRSLRDKCDGMFLLASLHMQSLASELTLKAIRERLEVLPNEIEHTYDEILERIDKADSNKRKLALDTISWIVFSRRPLKMEELQHALAVIPGSSDFDPTSIYLPSDIQDVCGGLVTVVKNTVSLVHYTAQSHFNSISDSRFPGFKSIIVQTCITYLSLRVLEQPDDEENQISYADDLGDISHNLDMVQVPRKMVEASQEKPLTYRHKCREFPFLNYAACFLGHHLRQLADASSQNDVLPSLMTLLQERLKRNFLIRLLLDHRIMQLTYADSKLRVLQRDLDYSELEYSSDESSVSHSFNTDTQIQHVSANSDSSSSSSSSPTLSRRLSLFEMPFFAHNVPTGSISSESQPGEEGVQSTSEPDDESEADIGLMFDSELLERVQNTSPMQKPITPMHLACFLGCAFVIATFVETEEMRSHINALDAYDRSPLTIAVSQGHWDVVDVLLKHGAIIDLLSKEGHTLLLHVAQGNRRDLVQAIISHAISPFEHVNLYQHIWIVGQIFLSCLRFVLDLPLVKYLLSLKQQLGSSTKEEKAATTDTQSLLATYKINLELLSAVESKDLEAIKKLLAEGKVNFKEETSMFNNTAFFLAIELDHVSVVKLFLEAGANVNMRGLHNCTPLHRAAKRNAAKMLRMLLEQNPSVDLRDDSGLTPWSSCLDKKHEEVLHILKRAGANPNVKGPLGVTLLYSAAAGGNLNEVRFLLDCGVDPSITTDFGWAPLHWAAHNGNLDCVQELLARGADLNTMSDQSTTPLDMAKKGRQSAIASILVAKGAKTAKEVLETADTYYSWREIYQSRLTGKDQSL